jgi:hypothetical protein
MEQRQGRGPVLVGPSSPAMIHASMAVRAV